MNRNMEAIVWAMSARGMSPIVWRVLVMLAKRVGKRGFLVWPAHRSLSEDCETSVSSVRRALAELEAGGWIKIMARIDKAGDRTSNFYELQVRTKMSFPNGDVDIEPDDIDDEPSIPEGRSVHSEQTPGVVMGEQTVCSHRTDGLLTGEQGTTQEEPTQEEESPSPIGEAPPADELALFGGDLDAEPPRPIEDFVVEHWTALKKDFPRVGAIDVLSPARLKKIEARTAEYIRGRAKAGDVLEPEDVWRRMFDRIRASTFLTGRDPPGRNYTRPFKLTIDYVLRPSQFLSILEDDDEPGSRNDFIAADGRRRGPAEQATRRSIERLYASS